MKLTTATLLLAVLTVTLSLHLSHEFRQSLEGDYVLSSAYDKWNFGRQSTTITFDPSKKQVSFTGCNINWASYKSDTHNINTGEWASTRKYCFKGDHDKDIRTAISSANSYHKKGDTIWFYNGKEETLRIEIKETVISGSYQLDKSYKHLFRGQKPAFLSLGSSKAILSGCNTLRTYYTSSVRGQTLRFTNDWITTLMACEVDHDSQIKTILSQVELYVFDGKVLTLLNRDKKEVLKLNQVFALEGNYVLSEEFRKWDMPDHETTINFSGRSVSFDGCNQNSASYQDWFNTVKFEKIWLETRKYCPDSHDKQIRDSFISAVTYKVKGDSLFFLDSKGGVTIAVKRKIIKQSKPKTKQAPELQNKLPKG